MSNKSTIEKLSELHYKIYGDSPEMSFWSFLESNCVNPNEKDLIRFFNELEKDIKESK